MVESSKFEGMFTKLRLESDGIQQSLAYGAEQCSVPLVLTAEEKKLARAEKYNQDLLQCRAEQLLDPFVDLVESSWLGEQNGIKKRLPISTSNLRISAFCGEWPNNSS